MSSNRREGMGRNKRSPIHLGSGAAYSVGFAMLVGAFFAYGYLTEPHRVFAKKNLDCDPWEVTWSEHNASDIIEGCGRSAEVV